MADSKDILVNSSSKRRLMFSPYDDYLYFTYNLMLILDYYKCNKPDKVFKDYHNIVIAADIINNQIFFNDVCKKGMYLPIQHYHFSRQRLDLVERVIYKLKNRGVIGQTDKGIYLAKDNFKGLKKEKVFSQMYSRLDLFKSTFLRFSTLTNKTFVESVYGGEIFNEGI